jgi:hypothetical protein
MGKTRLIRSDDATLRFKLSLVVFFASLAQFLLAYLLFQHSPILGSVFIASAASTSISGALYLFFLEPYFRNRQNKALANEKMSLTDLVDWKMSDKDFGWPSDERIVGRDWAVFLEHAPLDIKASQVHVLAERPVLIGGDAWLLAYVRCEEMSLDKHVPAFEGWVAHAPDLRDTVSFKAEYSRQNLLAIALTGFAVFGLVGGLISPVLRKLDARSLVLAVGIGISLIAGISALVATVLARAKFARGLRSLPVRFQALYSRLAASPEILFFRIVTGPEGLMLAAQPKESHPPDEHQGVVAIESRQGGALDMILLALKELAQARAA